MRLSTVASIVALAVVVGSCNDVAGPPDTITPPSDVTVTLVGTNSARISWTAPPEVDFVETYSVFRDGVKVGESATTFYIDNGLTQGVTYKYRVSANGPLGVVSDLSSESAASTLTVPDVTPPTVASTTPAAGASGVSLASSVTAVFSEPMDPSTITTATFFLKTSAGALIPGAVSYNAATLTAQFTPTAALPNVSTVSATVTTGVKDASGNSLQSDFIFSFTTRDEAPPTVVSTSPVSGATGVAVTTAITVTFNEAIDPTTLTGGAFTVAVTPGGTPVTGAVSYDAATNTGTFTPSAALAGATSYTATVAASVKDQAGNAMASAFSFSFTTADVTAPSVVSVTPIDGAVDVASSAGITITFSEAMDAATINASSIALTMTSSGAAIAGAVSYNAATMTATFTPSAGLTFSTGYTVTVATDAKDIAGNPLTSAFTSAFVTTSAPDTTAPTVLSVLPLDGAADVPVTVAVSVSFSEAMNPATLNGSTVTLKNLVTSAVVPASIAYDGGTKTLTLTPSSSLSFATAYGLTVTGDATDLAGNSLAGTFISSFTTASAPDASPPSVISSVPADGATNVSNVTPITVTFSEAMNPATINTSTIVLKLAGLGTVISGSVGYDGATRSATFIPAAGTLAFGTSYTINVSGATDAAGNAMAAAFTSAFTTSTAPDLTPPIVTGNTPANGTPAVSITVAPTVTFSEAMNQSTINGSTITLRVTATSAAVSGLVSYSGATNTATFTPSAPLLGSTGYTFAVSAGARDLAGNSLGAPLSSSFTTADVTSPSVTSSVPANGAVNVSVSSTVKVTFSEAMNPSTINGSTITLHVTGGAAVSGAVSYSAATTTATFTPSASLSGSTGYTLAVTTGARDLGGNPLASAFAATFTTADVTPPTVASVLPTNGAIDVPVNSNVTVTFSEAMNASTINTSTITLRVTSPSAAVPGTVSYNAASNTATFTPAAPLAGSTGYTVTVTTGAKDVAGNSLSSQFTASFTTVDTTPPIVESTSPADGSVGMLRNGKVTVTFSERMNPATISTASIKLHNNQLNEDVPGALAYDAGTRTATFTPTTGSIHYNTSHTLTVTTAVADTAGNTLASNFTASFQSIQQIEGRPYFSGTNIITDPSQPEIHVHLRFTQDGNTLGRPSNCEPLPDANCDLYPRNEASLEVVGPLDDTQGGTIGIAATVTEITGTFTDPGISFTIKLQNGRTFSFTGTVSASHTMNLTMSGATLPTPVAIVLDRF